MSRWHERTGESLEQAREQFENAIALNPGFATAHQWYASMLFVVNDIESAMREYYLAQLLGRTRDATPVYLDLFFEPDRHDAAVAEIANWPLDRWNDPGNPSLIEAYDLALVLAAAGARAEAFTVLESLFRTESITSWGYLRAARLVPEFVCSAEVRALFATAELPLLAEPFPCP